MIRSDKIGRHNNTSSCMSILRDVSNKIWHTKTDCLTVKSVLLRIVFSFLIKITYGFNVLTVYANRLLAGSLLIYLNIVISSFTDASSK